MIPILRRPHSNSDPNRYHSNGSRQSAITFGSNGSNSDSNHYHHQQQQQQQKRTRSHHKSIDVLNERTEYVVPLSVLNDAKSLSPRISITRHTNKTTVIHNGSIGSELADTNHHEISYTNTNNTNSRCMLLCTNSLKSENDKQSVSEPVITIHRKNAAHSAASDGDCGDDFVHKKTQSNMVRKPSYKKNKKRINVMTTNKNKNKAISLPVTPFMDATELIVDSSSCSTTTSPSNSNDDRSRSEPQQNNKPKNKRKYRANTGDIDFKLDHSTMSAPEDVMTHYKNARHEMQKDEKDEKAKSTALLDMMVNHGWTDESLLHSLQRWNDQ
eukprot:72797_1